MEIGGWMDRMHRWVDAQMGWTDGWINRWIDG